MPHKEGIRDSKNGFGMNCQKLSKQLENGLEAGEQLRDQRDGKAQTLAVGIQVTRLDRHFGGRMHGTWGSKRKGVKDDTQLWT